MEKKRVARAQKAEQSDGQRVRSRNDIGETSALSAPNTYAKNLIEGIAPLVAVAVARTARKVAERHAVFMKSLYHLYLVEIGYFIQFPKRFFQLFFALLRSAVRSLHKILHNDIFVIRAVGRKIDKIRQFFEKSDRRFA